MANDGRGFGGIALRALAATRGSIGVDGAARVVAISGALVWMLLDVDLAHAGTAGRVAYVILMGISWSHMSRRLSGRDDTDEAVG